MTDNDGSSSDFDPRTGGPTDGGASDVWDRLRRLENIERPIGETPSAPPSSARSVPSDRSVPPNRTAEPNRTAQPNRDSAPGHDATSVIPSSPTPAPNDPGSGRQYHVPAPGETGAPGPTPGGARLPERSRSRKPTTADAASAYAATAPSAPRAAAPQPAQRQPGPDRGPTRPARLRPKSKWFRPKLRWFFLYLPLLIMLAIGGIGLWGWMTFNDLYRVELGDALSPASGSAVNYLIVGSDSREGIETDTPNVGAIGTGTEVKGRRSDTIIVLRVDGTSAQMMSIPRDLWVTNVATGKKGRINGTYSQGPANLVRSVTANLGIPINRYIEVDFVSFAGMVDAVGGIDIEFPHPVMDLNSGLKIPTAGVHKLDGTGALAYVRSRHYTEEIDGKPRLEPTADIGRQQRQQNFIRTVLRTVGENRNPLTLARVGGAAAKGVRVDSEVGFFDMVGLARQLGGADPETKVLPTVGVTKGGASVLELVNNEALPILAGFGAA